MAAKKPTSANAAVMAAVEAKAKNLIETVLKPKHVLPPITERFNYISDIGAKWVPKLLPLHRDIHLPWPERTFAHVRSEIRPDGTTQQHHVRPVRDAPDRAMSRRSRRAFARRVHEIHPRRGVVYAVSSHSSSVMVCPLRLPSAWRRSRPCVPR